MPSTNLPIDLITDILSRLPVKSLVRFKSVSKPWKSLVEDPYFINLHQLISAKTQKLIVQLGQPVTLLSMELDSLDRTQIVNLQPEFQRLDKSIGCIIGSCNGLLAMECFDISDFKHSGEKGIIILNIGTREHKIIPILDPFAGCRHGTVGKVAEYDNIYDYEYRHKTAGYGFGYDAVGDDYKVVRIMVVNCDCYEGNVSLVYSLKKNEWAWSSIQDGIIYHMNAGKLVNGAIHWMGWKESAKQNQIVAFDLATEEYLMIPLPASFYELQNLTYYGMIEVAVLRGCLCINLIWYSTKNGDIWVMKNYMIQESWSKLFSITTEHFPVPVAAKENLLLFHDRIYEAEDNIYWYDPLSKKKVQISEPHSTLSHLVQISEPHSTLSHLVQISETPSILYYLYAAVYVESLVRVNNYQGQQEQEIRPSLKQGEDTFF